jgi:hypothetical protein
VLALALGALATLRASLQVSVMGIMTAITTITTTTIVITTKANPTGTSTAPTARRSTGICEQMPVSELAVMVQAAVNFKAHGEREKTHGGNHGKDSSARSIALSKSSGAPA